VGIRRAPIKFILLEFERIVNMPREVAEKRTRMPKRFEKIMLTSRRTANVIIESTL